MLQQVVSCCKLQVFYFGCFMCFHTHVARAYFQMFHPFFSLMLHSYCKCFILFGRGKPEGRRTGALRPADEGAASRGVLVLNRSSRLAWVVRSESWEREWRQGKDWWAQRQGRSTLGLLDVRDTYISECGLVWQNTLKQAAFFSIPLFPLLSLHLRPTLAISPSRHERERLRERGRIREEDAFSHWHVEPTQIKEMFSESRAPIVSLSTNLAFSIPCWTV
jgi:hypothetical protein